MGITLISEVDGVLAVEPRSQAEGPERTPEPRSEALGKSRRVVEILLVEDNPPDVEIISVALRDARLVNHIHVAEDGEKALKFLRREEPYKDAPVPDFALLDLSLPKVDGFQVLAEIKSNPDLRHIPVVVISGSRRKEDIRRAYDGYAAAYVTKPVSLDEFFLVIRTIKEMWLSVAVLAPHMR